MGAEATEKKGGYSEINTLASRVKKYISENNISIKKFAEELNYSRETMSRYINGKYGNNPCGIEASLTAFLEGVGNLPEQDENKPLTINSNALNVKDKVLKAELSENGNDNRAELPPVKAEAEQPEDTPKKKRKALRKSGFFESGDAKTIIGVCQACQEYNEMGILTGRSGYGKTYSLKEYAKLPSVAYIECDVTMSTRDLLKAIEKALKIPSITSRTSHERVNGIIDFLTVNKGYLIIIDEADKLMSRRTQDKMHILRRIFDGTVDEDDRASCGIVIAGEPKLEAQVKMYLEQFAKRIIFGDQLKGLLVSEVKNYLSVYEIEEAAVLELINRGCNPQTGCFRLLDRTMRNVLRILAEKEEKTITISIIKSASNLMML